MPVEDINQSSENAESGTTKRERSTIQFPYKHLNDAIKVAKTIFGKTGHGDCEFDQLATGLGYSAKSSGFKVMVSTARIFNLVEKSGSQSYKLTTLGTQIVDLNKEKAARAEAFLSVALFRQVYDAYRGSSLPPIAALEQELNNMGVADKQKDRARQVLSASAEQAGFFDSGKDRLVKPAVQSLGKNVPKHDIDEENNTDNGKSDSDETGLGGGTGGGNIPPDLDPILAGLIARLPKSGDKWPKPERELWLEILKSSFELVYKSE